MRRLQLRLPTDPSRSISTIVAALVCFAVVAADIQVTAVRLVAGCALCLVLPGLALADGLQRTEVRDWSSLALSAVGFSIVLTIVCGFVLFGVSAATPTSLGAVLAACTIGLEALATLKRSGPRLPLSRPDGRSAVAAGLVVVLALGVCVAAVALAYDAETADNGGGFTTFGITGPSATRAYNVTVTSHETRASSYVVAKVTSAGEAPVRRFVLNPGASDSLSISVPPSRGTVRIVLLRDGSPQWYRWLSIAPAQPS